MSDPSQEQPPLIGEISVEEYFAAADEGKMVGTFGYGFGTIGSATGDVLLMDGRSVGILWEPLLAFRISVLLFRYGLIDPDEIDPSELTE